MTAPSGPPAGTEFRHTDWPLLIVLVLSGVVAAFHVGKVPPALPALRAELGLSLTVAGWAVSLINFMGIAIGMLAGLVADRLGHRRVALGGLVCLAAADMLGALAGSPVALLAARFLEGLGFITAVVAIPVLVLRAAAPADSRTAMAIWSGYMPAGAGAMMIAAPFLLAPLGWRGLWVVNGALCLLCVLALALMRQPAPSPAARPAPLRFWPSLRATLGRRGPALLALCFCFYTMPFLAIAGFLPTYMIEQRGIAPALAGPLTALVVMANVIGNLASGPLQNRGLRRSRLIALAALIMGVCTLGIFTETLPDALRYGLCLLFSAAGGLAPGALFSSVAAHAPRPELVGATNGLMMQGSNLGNTLGPPAFAALVAATGSWSSGPLLLLPSLAICVAGAVALGRLERGGGPPAA